MRVLKHLRRTWKQLFLLRCGVTLQGVVLPVSKNYESSTKKRRSRKKTKGIIGKAYSKEDCQCENCASPEGDALALEGIMPLVAPVPGQEPRAGPDDRPESSETSDDPLGWQPVGEVITTTTIVGRASSSEGSDRDVPECERCENDGCRNRVGDWSYPECTSCWYEHN